MKRFFTWMVVVVVAAAMLVGCGGGGASYEKAVSKSAIAVARLDANQVLQKSGIYEELLRLTRAKMLSEDMPSELVAIAEDPQNLGIDVEAPVYGFVEAKGGNVFYVAAVAKMGQRAKLDGILACLERLSEGDVKRLVVDGVTFVEIERNVAFAYNDVAVMLGGVVADNSYGNNVELYLSESLSQALKGKGGELPGFDDCDAAVRLNMEHLFAVADSELAKLNDSEAARAIAQLEPYRDMKIDMALNFANGSIDLNTKVINMPDMGINYKPCSNDNLQYVAAKAWAVLNGHLVGEDVVKAIDKALEEYPALKKELDKALRSATGGMMNTTGVMAIAEPLIKSVDGDVTVALNNIMMDGKRLADIDAVAVVNVKNRAIFDQVSGLLAASDEVERVNGDTYSANLDGVTALFGQNGDLLYASLSKPLAPQMKPATEAEWYPAIKGSYGYAVINLDQILSNYTLKDELAKSLRREFGRQGGGYVAKWMDSVSYILYNASDVDSVSFSVVLKNKERNSLQQMVDVVKFDIIRDMLR